MQPPSVNTTEILPKNSGLFRSIRAKIIAVTCVLVLLSVSLVAIIGYYVSSKTIILSESQKLGGLRDTVKNSIEQYFSTYNVAALSLAGSPTTVQVVQEMSEARNNVIQEISGLVGDDKTWVTEARLAHLSWTEKEIAPLFSRIRNTPVKAESLAPVQDEAIVLQYFYTVTNPAALGEKSANNNSSFIASNTKVSANLRSAFSLSSYAQAMDRYHSYYLSELKKNNLYDILILDPQGNLVYSVQKETDFGINVFNAHESPLAKVFRDTLGLVSAKVNDATKTVNSGFVEYQPSYDAPSLFIGAPVIGRTGKVVGVVIIQLNPDSISRTLSFNGKYNEIGLGRSGEAYLINQDGFFVTDPRNPALVPDNTVKRPLVTVQGIQEQPSVALRLKDLSEAGRSAFSSSGLSRYRNYLGRDVLGAYDSLNISGQRFGLITQVDRSEVLAPLTKLAAWSIGAGLGTLALGAFFAIIMANQLSKPVRLLSDTAGKVAEGDLSIRAQKISNDEIGLLSDQFNNMLDQINARSEQSKKIMQTVSEALILLDTQFIIQPEYSVITESILRKNLAGSNFFNVLRGILTEKQFTNTRDFFDILMDTRKKEKLIQQTNPLTEVEFNIDDGSGGFRTKILEFRFNRILEGTEIRQLLVTIADITSRVQLQRDMVEAEKRAESQVELLFGIMHVEPRQLKDFLDTAESELSKLQQDLKSEEAHMKTGVEDADAKTSRFRELLARLSRPVHMVKGNASVLQLGFFVKQAHKLEDRIRDISGQDEIRGEDFLCRQGFCCRSVAGLFRRAGGIIFCPSWFRQG
jgi:HAMP domain-containing protein/HPt (histidine-containing phosphotransfer) domain-containing protein